MDTATSEYLFCQEFWAGDGRIFGEIFAAPIAAIEESLNGYLANCHDVIALVLMVRARACMGRSPAEGGDGCSHGG